MVGRFSVADEVGNSQSNGAMSEASIADACTSPRIGSNAHYFRRLIYPLANKLPSICTIITAPTGIMSLMVNPLPDFTLCFYVT